MKAFSGISMAAMAGLAVAFTPCQRADGFSWVCYPDDQYPQGGITDLINAFKADGDKQYCVNSPEFTNCQQTATSFTGLAETFYCEVAHSNQFDNASPDVAITGDTAFEVGADGGCYSSSSIAKSIEECRNRCGDGTGCDLGGTGAASIVLGSTFSFIQQFHGGCG